MIFIVSSDSSSHIFNHKGGLQLPANNMSPAYGVNSPHNGNPYGMSQPRDSYAQPNGEGYRMGQWGASDQNIMQTWPQQLPQFPDNPIIPMQQPNSAGRSPEMVDSQLRQLQQQADWPVRPIMPVIPNQNQINAIGNSGNRNVVNASPPKEQPMEPEDGKKSKAKPESETSSEDQESEYEDEEKPTEPPKKKQRKHKKTEPKEKEKKVKEESESIDQPEEKAVHDQLKMIHSDLEMEFLDHDGPSDRPGGAVLSLTLGKHPSSFFLTSLDKTLIHPQVSS